MDGNELVAAQRGGPSLPTICPLLRSRRRRK